jgi:NTE family protein
MSERREKLAFVLGGGGARGAMQVGALRALYEAGYRPDLLVGTSIGAANAAYLALHGFTPGGLTKLEEMWREAGQIDLLPSNYLKLTVQFLLSAVGVGQQRTVIRDFFASHGLGPDITFADLAGPRLILVATDLSRCDSVLYGRDPGQSVFEGLLASTAIPPWVSPLEVEDHRLMDGGLISNLPIEPAMSQGATRIIALNLADPRDIAPEASGLGPLITKMIVTVEFRQIYIESALARARGVPLFFLNLRSEEPVPIWDFRRSEALIEHGYRSARRSISRWPSLPGPGS